MTANHTGANHTRANHAKSRIILKYFVAIPVLLAIIVTLASYALASADDFSLTPILPPTQDPESRGFFDFTVTAGETQRIALEVGNTTERPIQVILSLATVVTNSNGIIDYTRTGEPDESMLHPFAEIARFADDVHELIIEPNSTVEVPIYIEIPAEGFDGIILGSVIALLGVTEEDGNGGGGMFINRFQRVIAVRMQENDTTIGTEFILGDVEADVINYRGSIVANVRNPMPRMVMGATVSAWVYLADDDSLVFSQEGMSVDFAPNTVFPLILTNPDDRRISSGDFVTRLLVEHEAETWEFEREFTVPEELVQEIDEVIDELYVMPEGFEIVEEEQSWWESLLGGLPEGFPIITVLSIALGIVLVLIIVVVLTMRSRKTSNNAMKMLQEHMEAMQQRDNTTHAAIDALLAATTEKKAEPSEPTEPSESAEPAEPAELTLTVPTLPSEPKEPTESAAKPQVVKIKRPNPKQK